jgi:hypothetical protein
MHRDGWLFPGQHAMKPISTRQLHRIVVEAAYSSDRGQQFHAIVGTNSTASWAGFMPTGSWIRKAV